MAGGVPGQLIGRDRDVKFVCGFVDEAAVRGGALLVSGDAGVGKTALLDVAAVHAEACWNAGGSGCRRRVRGGGELLGAQPCAASAPRRPCRRCRRCIAKR